MKHGAGFVFVAIAFQQVFFLHSVLACSRAEGPAIPLKNAFVVIVRDPAGNPLPGIEVKAFEPSRTPPHVEVAAAATTGKDGRATMTLVQDDCFTGGAAHGVSSQVVPIGVYDDGSGVSEVSLTWPGLEISLKNASSGSIAKGGTDAAGHFAFRGIRSGFYALHVSDPSPNSRGYLSKLEGDIPIEVRADAPNRELPFWGLVTASCGLAAYKDEHSMIFFGA